MKLAQRVVLGYYRNKFRALARISPDKAAAAAFRLFCTPFMRLRMQPPAVFGEAASRRFTFHGIHINGFYWKAARSTAPTVLICHGFNSGSYRFDTYIKELRDKGMNVLAFDAPGHATSGGKQINVLLYRNLILHVMEQYGPVEAIMAHSLGALAASLAAEALQQANLRLVLIAPATETTTAMEQFFKTVSLSHKLQPYITRIIENVGQHPPEWFSANRAVQHIPNPVLWLHDERDALCPYADTLPTRNAQLPNVQFVTTSGLGHSNIYRNPAVMKQIITFITGQG